MITLNASGGSVTFTFSGNSTYLNDGTIEVPVNSLALIIDESNMATFKKAASNDIFVSANIAEFGMTKAELESWYKENMVGSTGGGGGDITSGEVQTMIDESISGKMDTSAYTVDVSVNSASTNPVQNQALYSELRTTGKGYVPLTWDGHYTTNFESGTTSIKIVANNAGFEQYGLVGTDTSYSTDYVQVGYDVDGNYWYCNTLAGGHITTAATDNVMIISWPSSLGVTQIYDYQWGTPNWIEYGIGDVIVPLKDYVDAKVAEAGGGKAIEAGRGISVATGETADTISVSLPISAGTGENSIAEGNETVASGDYSHAEGLNTIASGHSSHAEGYYTTASGSNSHAEGLGTTASRNYSHAEGYQTQANNDCSHAEGHQTQANGYNSHAEGDSTVASGNYSHAEGNHTTASTDNAHAEGYYTIANNNSEHASGRLNVSNSASTSFGDSGNTLFSVGNGTFLARHNAFEIRQNGDIYFFDGTNDVKLQDVISNILNRLTTIENNS